MNSTDTQFLERFRAAAAVLAELPCEVALYERVGEAAVVEANQLIATAQILLRNATALVAAQVARRSAPELGSQGLAQRSGHRTAEQFIKSTNGVTGRDAVTAVRVGSLMREAAVDGQVDVLTGVIATPSQPWLSPVAEALSGRTISIEAAESIRSGLGCPNSAIS